MSETNIYEQHLGQVPANYEALTPLNFLERAAMVFPNKVAVIHSDANIRRTWAETYTRCRQFASALSKRGIGVGDTVSIICPNLPEHFEAHFAIPMTGAILNSVNTRLDAPSVAFILKHAQTKILITEREMNAVVSKALAMLDEKPLIIEIDDPSFQEGKLLGGIPYEDFLLEGDPEYAWQIPSNEWNSIS